MKTIPIKSIAFVCLLTLVSMGVFATGAAESVPAGPAKIRFMTMGFSGDPLANDSEVIKRVEAYTGVDLELEFVSNTVYEEKANITLASGDLPQVMLFDKKNASFINACKAGAFWELGPYLKEYPNLKDMNPIVLNNISVDGKVYSLYRQRDLGRNGIVYRADWLENIGMKKAPDTTEEFYQMLHGFTYKDPDKNGKDDTYGMVLTTYDGPIKIMATWFGVPNKFGVGSDGNLVAYQLTKEYETALKFFKRLFDEKLINQDFVVFSPSEWTNPIIAGKAGVVVDVLDGAGRWENSFITAKVDAKIGVKGTINGKTLPTSGYNGMFVIPKQSVKTEAQLRQVLAFMDKLNDPDMQDLLGWGMEGVHYTLTEKGQIDPQPVTDNPELKKGINDANQMLTFINNHKARQRKMTDVRVMQTAEIVKNIPYCVGNPAEPFASATYSQKGANLDQMIYDATYQYIIGKIDDAGWKAAMDQWKSYGGTDYVKEMNEQYQAAKK